jgi:8-oxo-dGTP pyrophosphatase MutT (NUDIX family)
VKAAYGEHHWSFPKGHTDRGETNYQAAWRETEEEVGLKKESLKEISGFTRRMSYNVKGYQKIVDLWLAELVDKNTVVKIDPRECEEYRWVKLAEGIELGVYEATKQALKDSNEYIMANILSSSSL